ncbi:hypothetical protein HMPREF3232_01437 [Fannyhessea vaginae]|nr:hypothetical protein HMPREF3232_01437 [Fannyhessea vaginae]
MQIYLHQDANTYVLNEYVLTHPHSPNNTTTHANARKQRMTKTLKFSQDEEKRIYLALQKIWAQHLREQPQHSNFFTLELLSSYNAHSDLSMLLETIFAFKVLTIKSFGAFLNNINVVCSYAEIDSNIITYIPSHA